MGSPPPMKIISSHQMETMIQKGSPTYTAQCYQMKSLPTKLVGSQKTEIQEIDEKHK